MNIAETSYGTLDTVPVTEERLVTKNGAHADTEAAVREYFKDIPIMVHVARCESTFRHTLADGSVLRGRVDNADVGVMQINLRYHEADAKKLGLDLLDINDNMEYARILYEKKGTQPWKASAPCWKKNLAML